LCGLSRFFNAPQSEIYLANRRVNKGILVGFIMNKIYNSKTGCCKKFNPAPWDRKTINFKNKLFLKDKVISFFHIPLNFGAVMKRDMERIVTANALAKIPIMLSDEKSLFGADVYIAVSKKIPGENIVNISGTFLSRVFEGPYKNIGKWVKEMKSYVKSKGKEINKIYFFYTTCPACAKVYGKNYVVLLARI
jgi:effector-binding domain-containing protein